MSTRKSSHGFCGWVRYQRVTSRQKSSGSTARKCGRKELTNKQTDFQNEVHALLDQQGITHEGSLWSNEGREFREELTLEESWQLLLNQWLEAINEFDVKIKRTRRKIETVARKVEEMDFLMSTPGIAACSGLTVYGEIGEVDRFDQANEIVSYAGSDPVVCESGDSRTETGGSASEETTTYGGFLSSPRIPWFTMQRIRI